MSPEKDYYCQFCKKTIYLKDLNSNNKQAQTSYCEIEKEKSILTELEIYCCPTCENVFLISLRIIPLWLKDKKYWKRIDYFLPEGCSEEIYDSMV